MFGFSIPKIILLLVTIFIVWQVFRIIEKRNKLKKNFTNVEDKDDESYEALIECKNCGNFYSKIENKACPLCGEEN